MHSQEISNYVGYLAKKKKVRDLINKIQKKIIKQNNRICVEGRDIASKILNKNPTTFRQNVLAKMISEENELSSQSELCK